MAIQQYGLVAISLLLTLTACGDLEEATPLAVNEAPRVTFVSVTPSTSVLPGEVVTLELQAEDPEGDAFSLSWRVEGGSFSDASALRTELVVPEHLGPLEVQADFVDQAGAQSSFSLYLVVGWQPVDDADVDGATWGEGDCNDYDASISRGAPELVDGKDNDCDGYVDEGSFVSDDDGDRWSELDGDCNDADPQVFPTRQEEVDGKDNDCDGYVDEETDASDDDGDGVSELEGDCNDARVDVTPGALEVADGVDNDCDGLTDEGTLLGDDDSDGFSEVAGDCDDTLPQIYPGAVEATNALDDDCDGLVDEGSPGVDDDGDGFSEDEGDCQDERADIFPGAEESANGQDDDCDQQLDEGTVRGDDDGDGFAEVDGDCRDDDAEIYPGSVEVLDGKDNDCDGLTDDGTPAWDSDGDGFSPAEGDCDDGAAMLYPGALEVADGLDQDCDGAVDESTILFDDDGDGFSEVEGDCDDARETVYPGADEVMDGADSNCDGVGDPNQAPVAVAALTNPGVTCGEVLLDGTGSYDPDGDPLRYYYWYLADAPETSLVGDEWILAQDEVKTSFVTDVPGEFTLGLIVSDGQTSSPVDEIGFSVTDRGFNHDPVAEAGDDVLISQSVRCAYNGLTWVCPRCDARSVSLNGGQSLDPDGDRLFFQWVISSQTTSAYSFQNGETVQPTLQLEAPVAEYGRTNVSTLFFKLEVRDCMHEKDVDSVVVSYACTGT